MEKTVVLDIGTLLAEKIKAACPDVKVVMTRTDDSFVELQGRADIANKAKANLFISIHVNSVDGKRTGPNGYSIHTLGQYTSKKRDLYAGNMEVVRRENSVIMLEDDYTTKYEGFDPSDPESYIFMNLMQNSALSFSICIDNNPQLINPLIEELKSMFRVRYNENLQLITIRYYTQAVIDSIVASRPILLEQRSRSTEQLIVPCK